MSALVDLEEKDFGTRTAIEHVIVTSHSSRPHRETAAAELAALRTEHDELRKAADILLMNLPATEIELVREAWGNTQTRIVHEARASLLAALERKP